MNLISSTIPECGAGADPAINALDAPYAVVAQLVDGALPLQGSCPVTKVTAAALTLATPATGLPSAGGDDGKRLRVFDTTGAAHTITTASNKIAPSHHVGTFGGTVGQFVELIAYGGLWYVLASSGVTVT